MNCHSDFEDGVSMESWEHSHVGRPHYRNCFWWASVDEEVVRQRTFLVIIVNMPAPERASGVSEWEKQHSWDAVCTDDAGETRIPPEPVSSTHPRHLDCHRAECRHVQCEGPCHRHSVSDRDDLNSQDRQSESRESFVRLNVRLTTIWTTSPSFELLERLELLEPFLMVLICSTSSGDGPR